MESFDDWNFSFLFDTILELTKVPDEKFIYFCEQYVHPIFRRSYFDEEKEEHIDVSNECIAAINKGLADVGLELKVSSQTAGRNVYKALPTTQGAHEPIKNIIFVAKYKPDIVIDDALSNDIKVVNANGALIYDQGIPADGISWELLVNWYTLLDIEYTEKMMAKYFYDSLDSGAERLFFKGYIALSIKLTDEEAVRLEASYTPRIDVNVKNSDPKAIAQMSATVGHKIAPPVASK